MTYNQAKCRCLIYCLPAPGSVWGMYTVMDSSYNLFFPASWRVLISNWTTGSVYWLDPAGWRLLAEAYCARHGCGSRWGNEAVLYTHTIFSRPPVHGVVAVDLAQVTYYPMEAWAQHVKVVLNWGREHRPI
jgi:hypothetical protein